MKDFNIMPEVFKAAGPLGILFCAVVFIAALVGIYSGVALLPLRRVNEAVERIKWSVVAMLVAPIVLPIAKMLWNIGIKMMKTVF